MFDETLNSMIYYKKMNVRVLLYMLRPLISKLQNLSRVDKQAMASYKLEVKLSKQEGGKHKLRNKSIEVNYLLVIPCNNFNRYGILLKWKG